MAAGVTIRLWIGPFIVDDAYITFRYAQNIADGAGFAYNAGERVLGTTTPLFTLVLAAFGAVGADIPATAFVLGVAADALSLVVLYQMAAQVSLARAGLIACALLVVTPRYLTYAVSGMETPLYVAAILASLFLYTTQRTMAAAFVCGLTVLLRPDGLILTGVLAAHSLAIRRRVPVRELALFAITLLPWLAFATWYFGNPLPTSILAKTAQAESASAALAALGGFFTDSVTFTSLTIFALAGLATGVATRVPLGTWVLWGVVYAGVFTATRHRRSVPWGYFHRGPVLDLVGLVSPEAIGRSDQDNIARARPDWIVTYDTHIDPDLLGTEGFRARYQTRWTYPVADNRSLLVFERR
jgi:hypothetical protein